MIQINRSISSGIFLGSSDSDPLDVSDINQIFVENRLICPLVIKISFEVNHNFIFSELYGYNYITKLRKNSKKINKAKHHMTGRWFSAGTPGSSTNKTDNHDIAEILLKVALNTIIIPTGLYLIYNITQTHKSL